MGQLGQSPDPLTNQVHSIINGQVVPVVRTDPQAYMVNDGTDDRVMIGGFGDGNFGIKVSQAGYDVKSAADSNLVMSSGFNAFKIVSSGTANVTVPGSPNGTYTTAVNHALGYVPGVMAWFKSPASAYYCVPYLTLTLGSPNVILSEFYYSLDSSNVTFSIATNSGFVTGTYTFKYYLLRETAS